MQVINRNERLTVSRARAVELFAVKGFGQVGMRELAAHLGIASGSIYHHYPSKQHLLFDIIEEYYDELLAALRRLGRVKKHGASAIIKAHLDLHKELPSHFSIAIRDCGCLTLEQQQKIGILRNRYESQLLGMLECSEARAKVTGTAVGHIIGSLLNNAPSWLSNQALQHSEGELLMESMLEGAMDRLLNYPSS